MGHHPQAKCVLSSLSIGCMMSLKCSHTLHSGLEIRSSQSQPQHLHHSTPSDDLIRADNLCECRARPHPPGAADFPGALAELAGAKIPSAEETPPSRWCIRRRRSPHTTQGKHLLNLSRGTQTDEVHAQSQSQPFFNESAPRRDVFAGTRRQREQCQDGDQRPGRVEA